MWGLAPDYQMLQADGQGEERTRLMVASIGLQKAPKTSENRKKTAFLATQDIKINRTTDTLYTFCTGTRHKPQNLTRDSKLTLKVIEKIICS